MSLMKCPECGNEISDLAEQCPNCGFPIGFSSQPIVTNNVVSQPSPSNSQYQSQPYVQTMKPHTPKEKNSVLGILALIFSIIGCTFYVGVILAIIDLSKKDNHKKTCSIAALIISVVWLIIIYAAASVSNNGSSNQKETPSVEISEEVYNQENDNNVEDAEQVEKAEIIEETEESQEEINNSADSFYVGDIVDTGNLKITFLSAEEYISDNQFLQPKAGNTYYRVGFEFENISKNDQYVSSWSFECYADGYSAEQTYFDDEMLDATLSSGKKTKGYVFFEVPKDAQSVILEYETNYWTENKIEFVVK